MAYCLRANNDQRLVIYSYSYSCDPLSPDQLKKHLETLSKLDPSDKTFWTRARGQCLLRRNKEQLS